MQEEKKEIGLQQSQNEKPPSWEKGFVSHIFDKGFISRMYKEPLKLNKKKICNHIFKWTDLSRHFSREDTQMSKKHIKTKHN